MSAALHIVGPEDLGKLEPLVAQHYAERGHPMPEETLHKALTPICDGIPQAVAYLIGPKSAPLGYLMISIGYTVTAAGFTCCLTDFFLRANVRGRGIGTETLLALSKVMSEAAVTSMRAEFSPDNTTAQRLLARCGFAPIDAPSCMVKPL